MAKLTRQYVEDHLVNVHTEESWARAIAEMVLSEAMQKLAGGSADEIVVDAKFHVTAVEPNPSGPTNLVRSPCIRVCVVTSTSGHTVCWHKQADV